MNATLSREEFVALLKAALEELDDEQRATYESHRIEPEPCDCARYNDDTVEPLWSVARAGAECLAYDDEEGEFGTGVLDDGGVLRKWGTWGTLATALKNFPDAG
jgi:hypothetical protein